MISIVQKTNNWSRHPYFEPHSRNSSSKQTSTRSSLSTKAYQSLLPVIAVVDNGEGLGDIIFNVTQDLNRIVTEQIGSSETNPEYNQYMPVDVSPLTFAIVFAAGLVTSLSPCTLSVLPLTIGYIGGYSKEDSSESQGLLLYRALSFYGGLVTSLSVLGIASSLFGKAYGNFGSGLPIGVSLIAILMGLNLLEVYPVQLPSFDVDVRKLGLGPNVQAYLAGVTFAFAASPCSTPVLVTLLAYVSSAQDPIFGALLLATYTTGFIAPLLIAATATEALTKIMSVRQYSTWITPASGILLLSGGTYALLTRVIPT